MAFGYSTELSFLYIGRELTVAYMDPTARNGLWPCRHATVKEYVMCHCMTPWILAVVPKCTAHLRAIVSFRDFTSEMKTEAEKFGINMKIQSGGMIAKHLFQYAYNYKLANMRKGLKQHEASPFFDKIVFSKIKEGLGGRIRLMIAGAAPLPGQIEEFMRVTSCSIVVQGYGLTESCAGCFTSIANVFSMIGTVGPPVTIIEAQLESVPEMSYDALSDMPLLCPSSDLLIS
ncbi:unnamed protein product [Miscanthus lutarioriparius]|uniref:AMP-dependent synthetase/ligase domain-containing protein n=1 Tax=Miscanthus lutarioriparius TaxID=422564 RepID=A0A811Q2M1_9POAL|nr:unnamed protein product [Miscanthus lutarioriparius]